MKSEIGFTGFGDEPSKLKTFFSVGLPKKVAEIHSRVLNEEESDDLQGEGMKIFIPSNIIDIWSRLEVLGIKQSGHTDTLTEASNLIDELYKRGEIETEQQYRNAFDIFFTN